REGSVRALISQHLSPFARAWAGGRGTTLVRTLRTAGLSLADVEERLADWLGPDGEGTVSTIPADSEVWGGLRARASTPARAARSTAKAEAAIVSILGDDCYGRDGETWEQVVARLLIERKLTLAVAESCTGGLLSHRLTSVPGSSAYFERSVLAYSDHAKRDGLGVPSAVLRASGGGSAHSAQTIPPPVPPPPPPPSPLPAPRP